LNAGSCGRENQVIMMFHGHFRFIKKPASLLKSQATVCNHADDNQVCDGLNASCMRSTIPLL
jgi:hypothetical protein